MRDGWLAAARHSVTCYEIAREEKLRGLCFFLYRNAYFILIAETVLIRRFTTRGFYHGEPRWLLLSPITLFRSFILVCTYFFLNFLLLLFSFSAVRTVTDRRWPDLNLNARGITSIMNEKYINESSNSRGEQFLKTRTNWRVFGFMGPRINFLRLTV